MGLSGAAFGASNALQDILARQMLQQQQMQQAKEAQARLQMEQQRIDAGQKQADILNQRQAAADALDQQEFQAKQSQAQTDRSIGLDAANVLNMPGMTPEAQSSELMQSALRNPKASSTPTMLKIVEGLSKKPAADPLVEYEGKKKIDAKYREPKDAPKSGVHVVGGNLVDDNGKVLFTDPNKTKTDGPSPYSRERATRTIQSVDELMGKVSGRTAGMGSLLANVPATDARNFKAELDTLKANIAFNELTAMREASKTGGALGQVSDRESQLLQSALGALDAGQSPENLKQQLQKVKESVQRWQSAGGTPATPIAPAASHGGSSRVDDLLKKYGGKG